MSLNKSLSLLQSLINKKSLISLEQHHLVMPKHREPTCKFAHAWRVLFNARAQWLDACSHSLQHHILFTIQYERDMFVYAGMVMPPLPRQLPGTSSLLLSWAPPQAQA